MATAWLLAIIDSANDAIISKTIDGIITSWNPAAQRLFGYEADEVIGKPIVILIPADHADEEPAILARLRRGERVDHYETVRRRKNGELVDISLTVSPICNSMGDVIGASKIARDITERKRGEQERERLLKEVQEASRVQDEFLAAISHELRTPLNGILGWASMMRASEVEVDEMDYGLSIIQQCANAQAQLIDDLLDVARIKSGKFVLSMQSVDLCEVLEAVLDAQHPAADAKRIEINLVMNEQIDLVSGDMQRLQQVFWNLLSNAIKFTPEGGRIVLHAQIQGDQAVVTVSDTGEGIAPDFLPFVFDRFRQADMASTRQHSGLGMGLSIVQNIVQLHGGSVRANSEGLGKGATFTVTLPLKGMPATSGAG